MEAKSWLWRYSVGVCHRPRLCIAVCLALTLVCSLGLFRVRVITNPDRIWVPPNSQANRQKEYFDDNFSPFFRVNQIFFVAEAAVDGVEGHADMIEKRYLQRLMSVQRAIEQASIISEVDGQPASLESLCFRPIDGESCLVESPSQYWLGDAVLLAGDDSPSLTAACQTTDDFLSTRSPCMDQIGTPVMREVVFGDIGENSKVLSPDPCGGAVPSAGALVLTFLLNNYPDPDFQRLAKQWEKEVFLAIAEEAQPLLENDVQAPMKVSYMAQRSVEDSLAVEAGENAWVLGVSYLCMFLYVAVILGHPCDVIRSRYSLALTGIIIVVSSLAITIGVLSLAGVGTTLIVWEVVPFLTLAIGVDNMVILSREFDRLETAPEFEPSTAALDCTSVKGVMYEGAMGPTFAWATSGSLGGRREESVSVNNSETSISRLEDRMAAAVSKVAPSILGAAVCEAVAFFVGSLTDIPALRQFCLVAATAVAVGFLLQVTWFMAALSLDARRVSQGRLDIAPWLVRDEDGYSKWWPASRELDPVTGGGSRMLRIPLFQGLAQSRKHRISSSSLSRRSGTASSTGAAAGSNDSFKSDDEPPRSIRETYGHDVNDRSGHVSHEHLYGHEGLRRERSFASEFGSGNETNPALFARSISVVKLEAQSSEGMDGGRGRRRQKRQEESDGAFVGSSSAGGQPSGQSVAISEGKEENGVDKPQSARAMNRRWFDDPHDYEGDEYPGKQRPLLLGSYSPPSITSVSNDPSTGGGNDPSTGGGHSETRSARKIHTPLAGPSTDRRAVLGGNVVEGYVSLGPSLDRHESREELSGGLLLAGPPDDATSERDGARGLFCGGSGSGLSAFREQLYEEGRYKGNLASRLLDRYYFPALFSRGGKIFTLAVAAGLAVLGGFGLVGLKMGLEPQLAAPTDFYLQDYYDAQFSLGEAGPPGYIVLTDLDYYAAFNDSDIMQSFKDLSTGLAQLQRYVQAPIYSWLDTMVGWVHQKDTLAADCPAQITVTDEVSFYAMVELFLSISIESQCCQSYGVCGAQFETDVVLEEDKDGSKRVVASRLRFNLQPLQTQRDYVNSYYYIKVVTNKLADKLPERYEGQRKANKDVGNLAFTYSLYFVYYEQYAYIQGVALQNIALAIAVVFLSIGVLSGFAIAWIVTLLVLCTTLGTVGLVWAWGEVSSLTYDVSVNAVSVCNLVMSLGLSVEFCLHVAVAFQSVPGTRQERAEAAMKSAGASVLTGITLTKLVGVSVLAIAPSLLFRVYYFRMYMATVVAGAFQGLAVLPVFLSLCGPQAPPSVLPRTISWADTWGDKHDEISSSLFPSPSPEHAENTNGGPGGALGWHWSRVGSGGGWDSWGEEEPVVKGAAGGENRLAFAPASHVQPGDSVVL